MNAMPNEFTDTRTALSIGDTVRVELPYSEVCMHMGVAGKVFTVRVVEPHFLVCPTDCTVSHGTQPMAQILREDGSEYCPLITLGEAGIFTREAGFYAYAVRSSDDL